MENLFIVKRGFTKRVFEKGSHHCNKVEEFTMLPLNLGLARIFVDKVEAEYLSDEVVDAIRSMKVNESGKYKCSFDGYFDTFNFHESDVIIQQKDMEQERRQLRYIAYHYIRIADLNAEALKIYSSLLSEFDEYVHAMSNIYYDVYAVKMRVKGAMSNDVLSQLAVFDMDDIDNRHILSTKDVAKSHIRASLKIFLLQKFAEALNECAKCVIRKDGTLDSSILNRINPQLAMYIVYNYLTGNLDANVHVITSCENDRVMQNLQDRVLPAQLLFKHFIRNSDRVEFTHDEGGIVVNVIHENLQIGRLIVGQRSRIVEDITNMVPQYVYPLDRSRKTYVMYSSVERDDAGNYALTCVDGRYRFISKTNQWSSMLRSKLRIIMREIVTFLRENDIKMKDVSESKFREYMHHVISSSEVKLLIEVLYRKDVVFRLFGEYVDDDYVDSAVMSRAFYECLLDTNELEYGLRSQDALLLLFANIPLLYGLLEDN